MSLQLSKLLNKHFPPNSIALAFGYGSKVVKQANDHNKNQDGMVDLVIAVKNPTEWHEENLRRNKSHYSFLKFFGGAGSIAKIQENFGAKIYFNPLVCLDNQLVKYGVIKSQHLIDDLLDWETLYISGRLHKPIDFIIKPESESFRQALKINQENALRTSLLLLPEVFTEQQLYKTIAGLSYIGDFRMIFGEDKNKIDNIVDGQKNRFVEIYQSIINSSAFKDFIVWRDSKNPKFIQDSSSSAILHNLSLLPKHVQQNIYMANHSKSRSLDLDDVLLTVSKSLYYDRYVINAINQIVRKSSLTQSIKGVFTAGFNKSLRYTGRKLAKSLRSRL